MRLLIAVYLLCLISTADAQINLQTLRDRCLPEAPLSTLRAMIQVESSGNPYAMQIDFPHSLLKRWKLAPGTLRLSRQPKDEQEALAWLAYLQSFHIFVDLGLMQVSTAKAQYRGISSASLFEPCTNLRTGWQILRDDYDIEVKVYGLGQVALAHAISRYNTGNPQRGIDNGYLSRVLDAAKGFSTTAIQPGRSPR